jgi:5-methylcytosine-specific restriction endonuclease McrA
MVITRIGEVKMILVKRASVRTKLVKERGKVCENCFDTKGVSVHHKKWLCRGGTNDEDNMILLCHKCHKLQHKRVA